ncbi:MAG TPA: sulfotransferase [Gammaproteobacteria bacterium]|nr:sulfotransferase [Gammaproteobacteria bacterium]
MPIKPVFVFGLPRSGSTLVQKILAAHPAVASAAEPWILLPLVYALRGQGIRTEYVQGTAAKAVGEFVDTLPRGRSDYYAAVHDLCLSLYRASAGPEATHFVDKTPRYHLVVDEILEIFPEARCILLWRNPLAIAASIINTWSRRGRWNLYRFNVDLYKGLENLIRAAQASPERLFPVRYEDMVERPQDLWPRIFAHLELDYDASVLDRYTDVRFSGSMGDPTGASRYSAISAGSVDAWREAFDTPLRRRWGRRYLRWLGRERLEAMGYDLAKLEEALSGPPRIRPVRECSDALRMTLGTIYGSADLPAVRRVLRRGLSKERAYAVT